MYIYYISYIPIHILYMKIYVACIYNIEIHITKYYHN